MSSSLALPTKFEWREHSGKETDAIEQLLGPWLSLTMSPTLERGYAVANKVEESKIPLKSKPPQAPYQNDRPFNGHASSSGPAQAYSAATGQQHVPSTAPSRAGNVAFPRQPQPQPQPPSPRIPLDDISDDVLAELDISDLEAPRPPQQQPRAFPDSRMPSPSPRTSSIANGTAMSNRSGAPHLSSAPPFQAPQSLPQPPQPSNTGVGGGANPMANLTEQIFRLAQSGDRSAVERLLQMAVSSSDSAPAPSPAAPPPAVSPQPLAFPGAPREPSELPPSAPPPLRNPQGQWAQQSQWTAAQSSSSNPRPEYSYSTSPSPPTPSPPLFLTAGPQRCHLPLPPEAFHQATAPFQQEISALIPLKAQQPRLHGLLAAQCLGQGQGECQWRM